MDNETKQTLLPILQAIVDQQKQIVEQQEQILERLGEMDERIQNLSLPGSDYSVY